ncbi:MAG: Maf family nucleotide pyrophosphatase [Muribaculaceae bacterium]|nr:Maf family nucleotide pyrophosphatase [Muribaculaceae bacterium]
MFLNSYTPPSFTSKRILLASNSPRRRELIAMILPEFEIPEPVDVNEVYPDGLAPEDVPVYRARLKAQPSLGTLTDADVLITADTVVLSDGVLLGKPKDEDDARRMLRSLSGRTHKVITGVSISTIGRMESFSEVTEVSFAELSEYEIDEYVRRYNPMDKAGAYGIQEYIGAIGITGIRGCFYNVMGLPAGALYHRLRHFLQADQK